VTIRKRLTCWYTGVFLASFILMAGVLYYELVTERTSMAASGKPKEPIEEEIGEILLFYGVPTAVIAIVGGWWLLRRALAPLDQLATAAERLNIDNLHEPLPRTGNGDEVDRLTQVLNTTNRRLEQSFEKVQEFTLNASHELKTPLAVLHGEIETALTDPVCTDTQREAFASQLDEIQRLTKIVEGLTLLARADAGKLELKREPVRLDELVRDSFADAQILSQRKRLRLTLGRCDEVTVTGDRHRLRQLLLNLTDNAVKYADEGGRVNMEIAAQDGLAELCISNSGPGVAPAAAERVFDRFFRGDESHSSDVEGSGLGLSIAQWIVKAHQGEIQLRSTPGDTTEVTVKLPRAAALSRGLQR
jgi:signal transduction histidine kinase